jgi:hypothetical protein
MNHKAENVKSEILNQLKTDGLTSTGFVRVFAGNVTNNALESVTIELTIYKYFCAVVGVITNDMHFMKLDCWSQIFKNRALQPFQFFFLLFSQSAFNQFITVVN